MSLRRRVRLFALTSALAFAALVGVFLLAYQERHQAEQSLVLTENLAFQTSQLRTVLFGSLLQPQTQPRAQVVAQFGVLDDLLARAAPRVAQLIRDDARTRHAWERVRRLIGDMRLLFAEFGADSPVGVPTARDQRTTDMLLLNGHALILFVNQLRNQAGEAVLEATRWQNWTLAGLLAGMAGLGIVLFRVLGRALLDPIQRMHATALEIAAGNQDLRLDLRRPDELGALADAFDRMLDRLQATTVSRDRLEAEIAGHARTERALRATEEWLRLALEVSHSFAFAWEPASGRVRTTLADDGLPGLPPEVAAAHPGEAYFQRLMPEDRARQMALVRGLSPSQDRYHTELRVFHGGDVRILEERARAFFDAEGRLERLVGAATDITERKRAEQASQQAQTRFQHLMAANVIGVLVCRSSGEILEANDYFCHLVGCARAELEAGALNWRELTPPEWALADEQAIAELEERGFCAPFEKEYQCRDGYRPVVLVAATLLSDSGYFLALVLDITERKRVEQQLRATSHYARSLIEASLDPLVTISREGTIMDVNRATETVTGLDRDGLIGSDFCDYFTEPEQARAGYRRVFSQGQVKDYPLAIRHASGRVTEVLYNASLYRDETGQVAGIFAAARDITERNQAEATLRLALAEKTMLIKEIHHRVKNNLQIIVSLLNLQASQVQHAATLDALSDTQGRIRSMALLHETLYQQGSLGQVDGAVYLGQLCAQLRQAFGAVAGRVRLCHQLDTLDLTLDQAIPCGLVVNELVSNAFKHAFPDARGGQVEVELHREADGRRVLVVTDDGVGMPADLDWRQANSLGLQLVAGLAQQLRGSLELQAGPGTRFRLSFPPP